ncbi:hypothetical protein [uncultured Merdimonas sp.]|uniref:hypothetical protein n=1 Tax=uncultured Merdimonas sp. TaxID=2023269 RepID=UPI00320AE99E
MAKVTEKKMDQIYNEYQENVNWPASEQTRSCYSEFCRVLDDYVAAACEDAFKNGYKYAMMQNGGAVHE